MPECYCDSVTHPNGECRAKYGIPNRDGPYFTKGKRYALRPNGNLYSVFDDKGCERYLSKQDGVPCPHLPPPGFRPFFPSSELGRWEYVAN